MRVQPHEFYDEQSASRYPFADTADLTSDDGLTFPADTFLDALLYPVDLTVGAYLASVAVSPDTVVLTLGDAQSDHVASGFFDPRNPPDTVALFDGHSRPAGVLIASPLQLAIFQTWRSGTHTFARGSTEFVASVCVPAPESCVRGVLLETGELFVNDVWLVGRGGVVFRQTSDGAIRVDAVGDPLFRRQLCAPLPDAFVTPRFVQTINGIGPDAHGGFVFTVGSDLAADTVLRIYPESDSSLKIEVIGQRITDAFD